MAGTVVCVCACTLLEAEEAEGKEEGLAEAARLARVGAEVEEELERARESARSLKECFGKRVPSAAEAAGWRSSGRLFATCIGYWGQKTCEKRHCVERFLNVKMSITTTTCLPLLHTTVVVKTNRRGPHR